MIRFQLASRTLLAMLVAAVLLPATVFAQFDTATVLGTVRDSSGAVVPGATVTLKNVATGIVATAVSDENGNYQFLNVRIGTYNARAELQGFAAAEAEMNDDGALRDNLRTRGLARAQQFSWAETARRTVTVYEAIRE